MDAYVRDALRAGLSGWEADRLRRDAHEVRLLEPDGPPSRRGPLSTSVDYRKLTPLVLLNALKDAGTVVCEPIHRFHAGLPADTLGMVLPALGALRALPEAPAVRGSWATVEGALPAARMNELQQRLRALTRGEGVVELLNWYEPVAGEQPRRP